MEAIYEVNIRKEIFVIGTLIVKRKTAEGFEALNRRDLDIYLKDWAKDAVLVFPGDIPNMSGEFTGKEAIRAWYQRDFEQFPTTRRRLRSVVQPRARGSRASQQIYFFVRQWMNQVCSP